MNFNNFFSKRVWFGVLMIISTLILASTAAYYSVFGLSSLFAGARTEVIIMASSLELSKLIVASYLHNHWDSIGRVLKSYLTIGLGILMLITSAGIYGFLTAAYQTTADQLTVVEKQTAVLDMKRTRFTEQLDGYVSERNQLNESISELTKGLSNNVIQYRDNETGQLITTTSSSTRRVLTEQLNDVKSQRTIVFERMEVITDSITNLDLQILDLESNNEVAAEIGPLRYISEITGKSMSKIVNWFTLLIVFVFDPLAIAMVIAVNKYLGDNNPISDVSVPKSKPKVEPKEPEVVNVLVDESLSKEEFLKQLDAVENKLKENEPPTQHPTPIYGGFSRKYSDGVTSNHNNNIKTY
jgi:hypothetical protein